jgi:putative SOS response-associated peptidase YedK
MCGRFTLHTPYDQLGEHFGIADMPETAASYNIAPSQTVPAVRVGEQRRELVMLRWGLVPAWARDAKTTYRMINARAESVAEKPAYRTAFRRRRCLVPADGFYEWRQTADGKQPYYIRMKNAGIFAFAGLWEHWEGNDEVIESCTIIVTEANDIIRPVHDRMPVIIAPADYTQWLDPERQEPASLRPLLRPYPAEAIEVYPVSRRVNSPKNNDAECIAPQTNAAS